MSWRVRLRHGAMLILLAIMLLTVGGNLLMQAIGWLRHVLRWMSA